MTWVYIAMLVLSLVMTIAMRPKIQHAKPPGLEEFTIPMTAEGRDIRVIFGTCWVKDFNVLYYGNLRNEPPIKAEGGK